MEARTLDTDDRPQAGRRPAAAIRRLTALSIAVALGMLVLGAVVLFDARRDAWRQAELASGNLTVALERDIARTIAVYDLSLQGAIDALKLDGFTRLDAQTRQMTLFDRAASAEYLGSILVLDPAGSVVFDSTATVPHAINFSDRDYFQVQRDDPLMGLYVSRPYRSRLRHGDASLAISRRLTGADGRFEGVVMGALRLAYFQDLFATSDLGAEGAITLLRTDGTLVVRQPADPDDAGRDMSRSPTAQRFLAEPSGSFVAVSRLDGVRRLYTFRHIGALPLVLTVAVSVDEIYAAWWRKAISIGSILAALCGATVTLGLLFRREMQGRIAAEAALRVSAERLAVMAATDVLTGLPNRRAFETALEAEWLRGLRSGAPVGLLLLDADYFKLYNDTYGHPEGDRVLQALAGCLRQEAGRAADLCVRYGGEEFIVLLPGADADAAAVVAERILRAVAELRIRHVASPFGLLSVSIGVAATVPRPEITASELVKRADAALYEAKVGGRCRVMQSAAETVDARWDLAAEPPLVAARAG